MRANFTVNCYQQWNIQCNSHTKRQEGKFGLVGVPTLLSTAINNGTFNVTVTPRGKKVSLDW